MFKFTVVRHPCDRLVSVLSFLMRGGMSESDRAWAKRWLSDNKILDGFVAKRLVNPAVRAYHHFRPQSEFLIDPRNDKIGVDFLGRFESLNEDFGDVVNQIDLDVALDRRPAL